MTENPGAENFWKRFLTHGLVSWLALVIGVAALVRTLPHWSRPPAEKLPTPPEGYLLDPRKAKVNDLRGSTFSWSEAVQDNRDGDHVTYGGWVADGDQAEFVAYGRAFIRGIMRTGIIALAHPDENRLHIEWPMTAKAGQTLQLTCGLTDRARLWTHRGAKVRLALARPGQPAVVLADDTELKPGEDKMIEITRLLTGDETKLILEVDNCGSQWWSTVFCKIGVDE